MFKISSSSTSSSSICSRPAVSKIMTSDPFCLDSSHEQLLRFEEHFWKFGQRKRSFPDWREIQLINGCGTIDVASDSMGDFSILGKALGKFCGSGGFFLHRVTRPLKYAMAFHRVIGTAFRQVVLPTHH